MSERFFNPFVGDKYWDGIGNNDCCVLVLGASVYCNHRSECSHYDECTSEDNKDSSEFNYDCPVPEYDSDGDATPLEDYPIYACSGTYTRFSNKMEEYFDNLFDGDSIWDHVAFTEYVQFFMNHKNTYPADLSERDLEAFCETLDELRPDVVIVWGDIVANVLRESCYAVEADDAPWDFAWEYEDMFVRFICCVHPASGGRFYKDFPNFAEQFEDTVNGESNNEESDEDRDDYDDDKEDDNDDNEEYDDEDDSDEYEEEYAEEDRIDEEDDDDDQADEDDDEMEENQEEECGEDGNGGNRPPCDLVLGLIMKRGLLNWLYGK